MQTHSMKLFGHCCWANLKTTWSLEVYKQWLLLVLCASAFTDPSLWHGLAFVSCCHSWSLVLCYNSANRAGIFSSKEILQLDSLGRLYLTLVSTGVLRMTHSLYMIIYKYVIFIFTYFYKTAHDSFSLSLFIPNETAASQHGNIKLSLCSPLITVLHLFSDSKKWYSENCNYNV